MNIFQKNLIKSIVKKSVPQEKQEAVFEVLDKIDLDELLNKPTALLEVLSNPEKLSEYLIEDSPENADEVDNICASDTVNESMNNIEKP